MQLFKYQSIAITLLVFAPFSCLGNSKNREINFYHWKTNLNLDEAQKEYLKKLGVKKLYVHTNNQLIKEIQIDCDRTEVPKDEYFDKYVNPEKYKTRISSNCATSTYRFWSLNCLPIYF